MLTNVPRSAEYLYQEFIFRTQKYRTRENLDFESVLRYLNNAIKELYTLLLPYKEYAYHREMVVTHKTVLSTSYYKPIRLIINHLEDDALNSLIEARYVSPREYFTITDWQRAQGWNKVRTTNPVYTIWNDGELGSDGILTPSNLVIYIAPNTDVAQPNPEVTANLTGVLEYYGLPADLVAETDVMDLPGLFEEFVLNTAVNRFLIKSVAGADVQGYIKALQEQRQSFQQKMETLDFTIKRELDSFFTPTVPYRMAEQLPGEMPQKLT